MRWGHPAKSFWLHHPPSLGSLSLTRHRIVCGDDRMFAPLFTRCNRMNTVMLNRAHLHSRKRDVSRHTSCEQFGQQQETFLLSKTWIEISDATWGSTAGSVCVFNYRCQMIWCKRFSLNMSDHTARAKSSHTVDITFRFFIFRPSYLLTVYCNTVLTTWSPDVSLKLPLKCLFIIKKL